jgi:hypothetical protein
MIQTSVMLVLVPSQKCVRLRCVQARWNSRLNRLLPSCPPASPSDRNSTCIGTAPTGRIFVKFDNGDLRKSVKKVQIRLNQIKISATLHEVAIKALSSTQIITGL